MLMGPWAPYMEVVGHVWISLLPEIADTRGIVRGVPEQCAGPRTEYAEAGVGRIARFGTGRSYDNAGARIHDFVAIVPVAGVKTSTWVSGAVYEERLRLSNPSAPGKLVARSRLLIHLVQDLPQDAIL